MTCTTPSAGYVSSFYFIFSAASSSITVNIYKTSTNTTKILSEEGDYLTLKTRENEVMHIITSGPVIVAQYTQSSM